MVERRRGLEDEPIEVEETSQDSELYTSLETKSLQRVGRRGGGGGGGRVGRRGGGGGGGRGEGREEGRGRGEGREEGRG